MKIYLVQTLTPLNDNLKEKLKWTNAARIFNEDYENERN